MKVHIQNFQSLKDVTLEFKPGITLITGPNGNGKSASFRAIRALLSNPSGCSSYIRHGEKEATVTLENNGNSITWIRKPDTVTYINNNTGEVFIKASKMDSRDLADLGFYFDEKDQIVNAPSEWQVLFPFHQSQKEMFRLFEDIFNISNSFQVIDSIKNEMQSNNKTINLLKSDLNVLDAQATNMNVVLRFIDKGLLDSYKNKIEAIKSELQDLDKDIQMYKEQYPKTIRNIPESIKIDILEYLDRNNLELKTSEEDIKNYKYYDSSFKYNISDFEYPIDLNLLEDINLNAFFEDINQFKSEYNKQIQLESSISNIDNKLTILAKELDCIKVCPTCGRLLNE